MKFAELAGQKEAANLIVDNVRLGRISHARLVIGHNGSGNLAMALAFAQYVNCTDKQWFGEEAPLKGDSCGNCPSCVKSNKMIHPDIHYIVPVTTTKDVPKKPLTRDFLPQWRSFIQQKSPYVNVNQWFEYIEVENKQGIISADECNEMLATLNYKTYESEYKIVIIWMIEKLYYAAAPKILKILEEPPEKTLFLLVSDHPQLILDTILSRVQLLKLNKPTHLEVASYLQQFYKLEQQKAVQLCDRYDSNLVKIIESLDSSSDEEEFMEKFVEWMRQCFKLNTEMINAFAIEFRDLGREKQKQYLQFVAVQLRNAWVGVKHPTLLNCHLSEQSTFYSNFGKYLHADNLPSILKEIEKAIFGIERNGNPRFIFTDASFIIGKSLQMKTA